MEGQKCSAGVGGLAQWYSTCLGCMRPWFPTPAPKQKEKRNTEPEALAVSTAIRSRGQMGRVPVARSRNTVFEDLVV